MSTVAFALAFAVTSGCLVLGLADIPQVEGDPQPRVRVPGHKNRHTENALQEVLADCLGHVFVEGVVEAQAVDEKLLELVDLLAAQSRQVHFARELDPLEAPLEVDDHVIADARVRVCACVRVGALAVVQLSGHFLLEPGEKVRRLRPLRLLALLLQRALGRLGAGQPAPVLRFLDPDSLQLARRVRARQSLTMSPIR